MVLNLKLGQNKKSQLAFSWRKKHYSQYATTTFDKHVDLFIFLFLKIDFSPR